MDCSREKIILLERLTESLKLSPWIESCETLWPTKLDLEILLPAYKNDLLELSTLLEEYGPQLLEKDIHDTLKLQISLITCCYESTAFILSEELADIQRSIRDDYIWNKLMIHPSSKIIVPSLFKVYRKVFLREDWYFYFGDLTSFWGFVWDLLGFETEMGLIDRDVVDLIELVCFKLLRSKSLQLCIKGVTIIEECLHKTRRMALMNYESVYDELLNHTWRLYEEDERNQQLSTILLAAMIECVKILDVDRNQLMTLIQNYSSWSRADTAMELLLRGLEHSKAIEQSIALMDQVIILLTVDYPNIRVIPNQEIVSGDPSSSTDLRYTLHLMNGREFVDLSAPLWREQILLRNNRFHRWTTKLLQMLVKEADKCEKNCTVYFQYLSSVLFFIADCPGVNFTADSPETFVTIFQLMVDFLEKLAKLLDRLFVQETGINPILLKCVQFFAASVLLVKKLAAAAIENCPNLSTTVKDLQSETKFDLLEMGFLHEILRKLQCRMDKTCYSKQVELVL